MNRVDQHKSHSCHKEDSRKSIFDYKYGQAHCGDICVLQIHMKLCKCFAYARRDLKGRICETEEEKSCVRSADKRASTSTECTEKCPLPCKETLYTHSNHSLPFTSLTARKVLNDTSIQENLLKVNIYYERRDMEVIEEEMYYKLENLLSDIGGQLGLFNGVSYISFVEFLLMIAFIVQALLRPSRSKEIAMVESQTQTEFQIIHR